MPRRRLEPCSLASSEAFPLVFGLLFRRLRWIDDAPDEEHRARLVVADGDDKGPYDGDL
jgi:hypothetical protein